MVRGYWVADWRLPQPPAQLLPQIGTECGGESTVPKTQGLYASEQTGWETQASRHPCYSKMLRTEVRVLDQLHLRAVTLNWQYKEWGLDTRKNFPT